MAGWVSAKWLLCKNLPVAALSSFWCFSGVAKMQEEGDTEVVVENLGRGAFS